MEAILSKFEVTKDYTLRTGPDVVDPVHNGRADSIPDTERGLPNDASEQRRSLLSPPARSTQRKSLFRR